MCRFAVALTSAITIISITIVRVEEKKMIVFQYRIELHIVDIVAKMIDIAMMRAIFTFRGREFSTSLLDPVLVRFRRICVVLVF